MHLARSIGPWPMILANMKSAIGVDLARLQCRRRIGHLQLGRSDIGLLEAVAAPVAVGELVERRHAAAGSPALDESGSRFRGRARISRRLAPSGIWLSILRPSPAQPWHAWQLPFWRNSRAPAAISAGSGACACAAEPNSNAPVTAMMATDRLAFQRAVHRGTHGQADRVCNPRAKSRGVESPFRDWETLAAATATGTVRNHAICRCAAAGPVLLVVGHRRRGAAARHRLGPQARAAGLRAARARPVSRLRLRLERRRRRAGN